MLFGDLEEGSGEIAVKISMGFVMGEIGGKGKAGVDGEPEAGDFAEEGSPGAEGGAWGGQEKFGAGHGEHIDDGGIGRGEADVGELK